MRAMQTQTRNAQRTIIASRTLRGASAALAALACAALISACGSSGSSSSSSTASTAKTTVTTVHLNTARVASSIEQSITAQRHKVSHVVCPAVVVQAQGVKFECKATVINPGKASVVTPFLVTVTNSKGYVTYVGK